MTKEPSQSINNSTPHPKSRQKDQQPTNWERTRGRSIQCAGIASLHERLFVGLYTESPHSRVGHQAAVALDSEIIGFPCSRGRQATSFSVVCSATSAFKGQHERRIIFAVPNPLYLSLPLVWLAVYNTHRVIWTSECPQFDGLYRMGRWIWRRWSLYIF